MTPTNPRYFSSLASQLSWPRVCNSLLIMLTSLAPSPMASVMAFLYLFTRSTTMAFCLGVTRQQMTALHSQARSTKFCCCCSFLASSLLLLWVRIRLSSSVLGNFSFRILLFLVFFSRRISFCKITGRMDYYSLHIKSTIFKTSVTWRLGHGYIIDYGVLIIKTFMTKI